MSSWSGIPCGAIQPGCVQPRSAGVPPATTCTTAAEPSARTNKLPCPASLQPGLCGSSTQDRIMFCKHSTLAMSMCYKLGRTGNNLNVWHLFVGCLIPAFGGLLQEHHCVFIVNLFPNQVKISIQIYDIHGHKQTMVRFFNIS